MVWRTSARVKVGRNLICLLNDNDDTQVDPHVFHQDLPQLLRSVVRSVTYVFATLVVFHQQARAGKHMCIRSSIFMSPAHV